MESQFNHLEFSDVILDLINPETKEQKFLYSHKVVLAGHSDFFRRLFQPGFKESNQEKVRVEVPDIEMATELIRWMYTKDRFVPMDTRPLAEMWLMKCMNIEEIPYPGVQGEFIHEEGNWDTEINSGSRLNREISYHSITPNSMIKKLSIYGYTDGNIRVGINFPTSILHEASEDVINELNAYMQKHNINMGVDRLTGFYISPSYNPKQAKSLAEIVTKHNHFGKEDLDVINGIISNI